MQKGIQQMGITSNEWVYNKLLQTKEKMDIIDDDRIELNLETVKEISFGGAIGILAGYASTKAGLPLLLSSACFVLYRGSVYDGYVRTTWSPLAIDDASITRHMYRKLRRETVAGDKRLEKFLKKNAFLLLAFSGGLLMGKICS